MYAVDIGGTNFRTLYVRLSEARGQVVSPLSPNTCLKMLLAWPHKERQRHPDRDWNARLLQDEVDLQEYAIEDYHFTCHATELFDLLARRIVEFVRKEGR